MNNEACRVERYSHKLHLANILKNFACIVCQVGFKYRALADYILQRVSRARQESSDE